MCKTEEVNVGQTAFQGLLCHLIYSAILIRWQCFFFIVFSARQLGGDRSARYHRRTLLLVLLWQLVGIKGSIKNKNLWRTRFWNLLELPPSVTLKMKQQKTTVCKLSSAASLSCKMLCFISAQVSAKVSKFLTLSTFFKKTKSSPFWLKSMFVCGLKVDRRKGVFWTPFCWRGLKSLIIKLFHPTGHQKGHL